MSAARTAIFGQLRSVADFYIPFRIFQLEIHNRGRIDRRFLAVDSVTGMLSPYSFPKLPADEELVFAETRNLASTLLSEQHAREIAITKMQRLLFISGFFRVRELKISAELMCEVHVPYWIGFRGNTEQARFTVMDAVRRRIEGAKLRQIIRNWLISRG